MGDNRPMHLLAFDTSTDRISLAVERDGRTWTHDGPGGPQASATMIPAIHALMAQAGLAFAALDAIVFGRGPGSFTGLRTACSVAQGLAFGASVPVLPVDTLLAVAEEARHAAGCTEVLATLDARMDEVYFAHCVWRTTDWQAHGDFGLAAPEQVAAPAGWAVAGNAQPVYPDRLTPGARHVLALPTASALLRLAPALLAAGHAVPAEGALPRYVRDKVAQTTAERLATRAAQTRAAMPAAAPRA